ncbi:hypothetical protein JW877_10065 [bacterium]|nr:hypothetical protein [bacterium]
MKKTLIIFTFLTILICSGLTGVSSAVLVARNVHPSAAGLNNQRQIVRDSSGKLYIAYPGYDGAHWQIFIACSDDNGATWDPLWATITSNALDDLQVTLAIDSHDTLHLVWKGNLASNDADLMYRKYPGGSNYSICNSTSYPGANCPSLAVGPNDDLHVAYSGCPSSWSIRYLHFNRSTGTWDPPENVSFLNPSRWPSIEADSANDVHIIYRNQPASHYRVAHKAKISGIWQPVEQLDILLNSVEYTSLFIDNQENLHATWVYRNTFYGNPDTVKYRRYNDNTGTWEGVRRIFGTTLSLTYDGDVVVDTSGNIYVLYHIFDSCFVTKSTDNGVTFSGDSCFTSFLGSRYPNARGSKYPPFNRVTDGCLDVVYTWTHPDSMVSYLVYDNLCGIIPEEEETTWLCANFIEPNENSYSSCSDQQIVLNVGCCDIGDSMRFISNTNSVEFLDSTTMTWEPAFAPDPSIWLSLTHIPDAVWIWTDDYPAPSYHGDWFRSIINSGCSEIDSAWIGVQCDNQATVYMNGTYVDTTHGNSGSGYAGWRTRYEFNLTPYMHGGLDTLTFIGFNSGGQAGLIFEVFVLCKGACCGEIEPAGFEFSVNGESFFISDPELSFDGDSLLTFTPLPPDTFGNGDTIHACLLNAADTCGGVLDSVICRYFFIDLLPPAIRGIQPAIDTTITDTTFILEFFLHDSLSGLDTTSIFLNVNGMEITPLIDWQDSLWYLNWSPPSAFRRGDTINICLVASDTTDYCPDNVLDTCWSFYIQPCVPIETWLLCPATTDWSSCTTQVSRFGARDSTGFGIDTSKVFFSAIIQHAPGILDTIIPDHTFRYSDDTLFIDVRGEWEDGDTVTVILDSLFSNDGCKTIP